MIMKIGEFKEIVGISIDTLRYYDKIGLLSPQREKGERVYTEEDIIKANTITLLKNIGCSLNEVKKITSLDEKLDSAENTKEKKEKLLEMKLLFHEKERQLIKMEEEIQRGRELIKNIKIKIQTGLGGE